MNQRKQAFSLMVDVYVSSTFMERVATSYYRQKAFVFTRFVEIKK